MTISEVVSDWATAWKNTIIPVRVTRFLTIVPSWEAIITHKMKQKNYYIVIRGAAFGAIGGIQRDSFNLVKL